ncbi:UbiA prenyltransferase family-domain-containing protein, partial [Infundibulicybe gibba]
MLSPSSFSLLDLYPLRLTTSSDDDSRVYSFPQLDLMHHAKTLYLFTKSDIKTIIIPVTLFASLLAPIDSYSRIWTTLVWIWVHLLHFCIANQCFSVSEDASNKPWRPIPSGRITPRQASLIRWALAPACLSMSSVHGALPASCTLLVATWLYNDMGFHEHGLIKNLLNVIGYVAFEAGATMVAAWHGHIHGGAAQALGLSGAIILTTVHAGDIPDVDGDLIQGRRTLPILFPKSIRPMLAATLLAWS